MVALLYLWPHTVGLHIRVSGVSSRSWRNVYSDCGIIAYNSYLTARIGHELLRI